MGTSLSVEEKLFVKGSFGDLVVGALQREADHMMQEAEQGDASVSSSVGRRESSSSGFQVNSKLWQLITALCEKEEGLLPDLLHPLQTSVSTAAAGETNDLACATTALLLTVTHVYIGLSNEYASATARKNEKKILTRRFYQDLVAKAATLTIASWTSKDVEIPVPSSALRSARGGSSADQSGASLSMKVEELLQLLARPEENSTVHVDSPFNSYWEYLMKKVVGPLGDAGVFNRPVLCVLMGYLCAVMQLAVGTGSSNYSSFNPLNEENNREVGDGGAPPSLEALKDALATLKDSMGEPLEFIPAFYQPLVKCSINETVLHYELEDPSSFILFRGGGGLGGRMEQHHVNSEKTDPWAVVTDTFIGQKHVIQELKESQLSKEKGLSDDTKPTVLVFFGPSGHGKSELGKHYAKVIQAKSRSLTAAEKKEQDVESTGYLSVIHMPNFCTKDSIYSLVDPPTAHVGEGILLTAIKKREDVVVVLDEFEKSHNEPVQNVWLSAFQNKGMLRSLKESSRSVSTQKVTFILTVNTAADIIEKDRKGYLASSDSARAERRKKWSKQCADLLRQQYGDPLVNRIDKMIPFVPYTSDEREEFVSMQLTSLSKRQKEQHGRRIGFTPSLASYLSQRVLKSFHNPTLVVDSLRPILLKATAEDGQEEGTLTVVHATPSLEADEQWDLSFFMRPDPDYVPPEKVPVPTEVAPPRESKRGGAETTGIASSTTSGGDGGGMSHSDDREVELELEKEVTPLNTEKKTQRELKLEQELETTKDQLKQAHLQIETLKDQVKHLEYMLGVMLVSVVACFYLLSFVVSFQLLASMALLMVGTMYLLVKNFWSILQVAIRGVWRLLQSPYGALVVGLLAFLLFRASGLIQQGSPPCPPPQIASSTNPELVVASAVGIAQ